MQQSSSIPAEGLLDELQVKLRKYERALVGYSLVATLVRKTQPCVYSPV
jgi:hypothetical protein